MMEAVDEVNEAQKNVLFRKLDAHFEDSLRGKTIAIWGLAFKPRTDDIRESPALVLIDSLLEAGAHLRVHDPEANGNVRAVYGDRLTYCDRPYGALEQADALVISTEWNEFRNPDFEVMFRLLRQPVIFDGRNVYDPARMKALGFTYHGIGRAARPGRRNRHAVRRSGRGRPAERPGVVARPGPGESGPPGRRARPAPPAPRARRGGRTRHRASARASRGPSVPGSG